MKNLQDLSTENVKSMSAEQLLKAIKDRFGGDIGFHAEQIQEANIEYSMLLLQEAIKDGISVNAPERIYFVNDTVHILKAIQLLCDKAEGINTNDEDTISLLTKQLKNRDAQVEVEANIKNSLYSFLIENKLMGKYQKWYEINGKQSIDWEKYAKGLLTVKSEDQL